MVAGTITESSVMPAITSDLTIDGGGKITVSGGGVALQRTITVNSGTVAITNLTVTAGNEYEGGGIYSAGTMTLTNVTVTGNTVGFNGGGVSNGVGGSMTIVDSTIAGNSAQTGGGIFNRGTLTVSASTVAGNSVVGGGLNDGGGLYNVAGATATIANSTFSGNTADLFGGAIYSEGTVTVTNATITGNTAGTSDGGIKDLGTSTVVNSIVAGNTPDTSSGIDTTTASLVGVSTTGLLDPAGLADGGPTQTIRLLATATSAIDQGNTTACGASPVSGVDQRGVTRSERATSAPTRSSTRHRP